MGLFSPKTDRVVKMVDAPEMVVLEDKDHNMQIRFTKKVTFEAGNVITLSTSKIYQQGLKEGRDGK